MAQRVARGGIRREQNYVHQHDYRTHADAETLGKAEGDDCVVPKKAKKYSDDVKEIAVHVLQDQRKGRLAAIATVFAFADSAGRRMHHERTIIRLAIVITGEAKAGGSAEDK